MTLLQELLSWTLPLSKRLQSRHLGTLENQTNYYSTRATQALEAVDPLSTQLHHPHDQPPHLQAVYYVITSDITIRRFLTTMTTIHLLIVKTIVPLSSTTRWMRTDTLLDM